MEKYEFDEEDFLWVCYLINWMNQVQKCSHPSKVSCIVDKSLSDNLFNFCRTIGMK